MNGFFRILESNLYVLFCTRLWHLFLQPTYDFFFIWIKVYEIVFAYNCVLNCAWGCARREKKGMTADFMHELDLVHLRNCKQDMHMIYEKQTLALFMWENKGVV